MEYVSVADAARLLGVSGRTIRTRIEQGAMKAEAVNPRLWLIPFEEIERWKGMGSPPRGRPRREKEDEAK